MLTSCISSSDAESNHTSAKVCHLSHGFAHACRKGALHVGHWMSRLWTVCPCISLHTEQSARLLSHGAAQPSHLILPQSHWSHSMRRVPLMGSQVVQWHPVHLPYLLKVLIHFFAGVGASAPARTMLCGCSGATSSSGSQVPCLARRSISLFRLMSCWSAGPVAWASSLCPGIHLRLAPFCCSLSANGRR